MTVFNNMSEIFMEIAVLPFLFVLSAFLGGRMATKSEINRRFFLLVISTLAASVFEIILELTTDISRLTVWTKLFYAVININAYCLMCYVAAYTRTISKRFVEFHFFVLVISVIMLFVLSDRGHVYMIFSPGFAVIFVVEGFVLQLVYQKYYGNGQFIVMNLLFMLLIDSFLVQYLFNQNMPLVYTIATIMLVFTFFYLEAPTYRRLISAQHETEDERRRAEASMTRAAAANRAKSNFLASTSHEIRTPMNAILGINDMILSEAKDAETLHASSDIKTAGEHLLNIVNNILDISKIEAGKMDLYESDYHLWELLKECEKYVIDATSGKPSVKFILSAERSMPEHLHGDVLRLKQVLTNLLGNSAKYTEQGNIVLSVSGGKISGAADGVMLNFIVEDTGMGMKPYDTERIFEPFERANVTETRHISGAGLGLSLVKNIINIMKGHIELESEYGKGTRITFNIPQRIVLGDDMTIDEYEEFMSTAPIEGGDDNEPSVWPDAKILVVDDTPVNLVVAKGMLKESMAHIETAESGEDALELIKANHYDIVFLDHKMPGMDGPETLRKAKPFAEGTAFVALTANTGGNIRDEYIAMGFDDYLPKPFKSLEMMKVLKEFLNKKA